MPTPAMFGSMAAITEIDRQTGCIEKLSLARVYNSAVAHYAVAVGDLIHTRGKTSKKEYQSLMARSEAARIAAESTRLDLERHTQKHGC